jgi:hypothetical protein
MKALHQLAHVLKKQAEAQQQKGNHGTAAGLSAVAAMTALLSLLRR